MSRIDEMRELFNRIQDAWAAGERTAMLTITIVQGSAYRRPGAKMMMSESGRMLGTLSGGCLESDLYGWATKAMEEGQPRLVEYDLSENELWSLGLGCKGTLEVAIFPILESDTFWHAVRMAALREGSFSVALELPVGARVLFESGNAIAGDVTELPSEVLQQLVEGLSTRLRAEVIEVNHRRFFIDTVRPSERLIVCGAGHDAVPVAALSAKCGFRVSVLDPRKDFNGEKRFPGAEHIMTEPEDVDALKLRNSWWVIMNHLQHRDERCIELALRADPKYIGILGPLSRTREMLNNIGASLESGPIHAPIGLDVCAETIDEVAISVVAELLAVQSRRTGLSLHGRDRIHN